MFDQESYGGQIMLAAFGVAATIALWIWLSRGATGGLLAVSLGLIMGGAIGNAIDRVVLGGVADFFSLHAFGFYWYVFNIAVWPSLRAPSTIPWTTPAISASLRVAPSRLRRISSAGECQA